MLELGPRVVVAGTSSGVGKTTVATGLMAALRGAGYRPAGAKVGPDFIDPGYHALACGRPPRNLDAWLCGPQSIGPLAARAAAGADLLVIEGVMGLFDGASDGTVSSTADVARLLEAPVLLVVDASAMSSSVAALVHGYATFDPTVNLAGVILNRVGSEGHEVLLREALAGTAIPVVGALHRDDGLQWRDRHLGLVPVAEEPERVEEALDRLAAAVAAQVDLDAVVRIARSVTRRGEADPLLPRPGPPSLVAVAAGAAFTFTYTDTVEALTAAGAEVVTFDPLTDAGLPEGTDGLIVGGGFPEVHAAALSANEPLLTDLRRAAARGIPIWAECGGLILMAQEIDGRPMAGVVPGRARMTDRLTLGYRTATTATETPLGPAGVTIRGHEFHYSTVEPAGDAIRMSSRWGEKAEGFGGPAL
ncbi:MAG TPA: cobyrinate a,c-diamide synthase, partial [Acidimicrobiales bacterium]|nr:cobyrinate a,c-diamide synthase [Acidimicrobiales bacterium]